MVFFKNTRQSNSWLTFAPQCDGVAAAIVTRGSGLPRVERAEFFAGTVDSALLEMAGKEMRASGFRCATLLAPGEYQLLSVDAPNVPDAELKTAVRWRLKDMLDFPAAEASIDVLRIPVDTKAAVRPQQSLLAVAAPDSVVGPRQRLFSQARVPLSVIDIPEMAQRNVAARLEPEGRGLAMLAFDDDGALLTVSFGGELCLARRIELPLAQLADPDADRRLAGFDRITLELQRSLDNFERQFSFISVARLVLGPSTTTGLDEYLSSNLYTPVETLDLARIFDLEQVPELAGAAQQQRFFGALGAGLRDEGSAA